jgi:hypothetical protein
MGGTPVNTALPASQGSAVRFVAVWTLAYLIMYLLASIIGSYILFNFPLLFSDGYLFLVLAALLLGLTTVILAGLQQLIARRFANRSLDGWLRWTAIGAAASMVLIMLLQFVPFAPGAFPMSAVIYLWLLPPALAQAWTLRNQVRRAWLWAIAWGINAVLVHIFLLNIARLVTPPGSDVPLLGVLYTMFHPLVIGWVFGVVSGVTLWMLWQEAK